MKKEFLYILIIYLSLLISCVVNTSPKISFEKAKSFMEDRCKNISQTYIKGITIQEDQEGIYLFLSESIDHNGVYCISTVSKNELKVIDADCGRAEKLTQFYLFE